MWLTKSLQQGWDIACSLLISFNTDDLARKELKKHPFTSLIQNHPRDVPSAVVHPACTVMHWNTVSCSNNLTHASAIAASANRLVQSRGRLFVASFTSHSVRYSCGCPVSAQFSLRGRAAQDVYVSGMDSPRVGLGGLYGMMQYNRCD